MVDLVQLKRGPSGPRGDEQIHLRRCVSDGDVSAYQSVCAGRLDDNSARGARGSVCVNEQRLSVVGSSIWKRNRRVCAAIQSGVSKVLLGMVASGPRAPFVPTSPGSSVTYPTSVLTD